MNAEQDAYNALCGYTLGRGDAEFIHQHVVDAFAAQHADEQSRPIGVVFALVGLYLLVEKHFSGRQVQRVHMQLGRQGRTWPAVFLPQQRGSMTALEVITAREGAERDAAIHAWCASVWAAFVDNRQMVADLLRQHGVL
jgi:hypothetical protein